MLEVEKLLKELPKLQEYEYPTEQSSIFLLPNGKMYGHDIIFDHCNIFENILGKKLESAEFFKYLIKSYAIRLIVDDSVLYININTPMSTQQKKVMKNLVKSNKYKNCVIDNYNVYVKQHIGEDNIQRLDHLYNFFDIKPIID